MYFSEHTFEVGEKVYFKKEGEKLIGPREGDSNTGYDLDIHTVMHVIPVPPEIQPGILHEQWVVLENGRKYSGWYFKPAETK